MTTAQNLTDKKLSEILAEDYVSMLTTAAQSLTLKETSEIMVGFFNAKTENLTVADLKSLYKIVGLLAMPNYWNQNPVSTFFTNLMNQPNPFAFLNPQNQVQNNPFGNFMGQANPFASWNPMANFANPQSFFSNPMANFQQPNFNHFFNPFGSQQTQAPPIWNIPNPVANAENNTSNAPINPFLNPNLFAFWNLNKEKDK